MRLHRKAGITAAVIEAAVLAVIAGLFWLTVSRVSDVAEPWDADAYWRLWYPVSLALSATAGIALARLGWLAGAVVTFMQFPVMWIGTRSGSMWIVGLAMLTILAVPAMLISALTGWLVKRGRSA